MHTRRQSCNSSLPIALWIASCLAVSATEPPLEGQEPTTPAGEPADVPVVTESPESPPAIVAADLVGTWRARPEHNGQVSDFVIRFEADEDGALEAVLSLPPLDARDVAAVPVKLEGDRVLIGDWALRHEPDGGLSGEFPATMVPVHRITFTLYRGDPIEPQAAENVEAPVAEPVWTREHGSPAHALRHLAEHNGRSACHTCDTFLSETRDAYPRSQPVAASVDPDADSDRRCTW